MNLYIAEKPSLARAIVDVLPKPHKKENGFIRVGNGDCVSWCIGHLLEHVEPDVYDPRYKQWRMEHLPIMPEQWQVRPKMKTKSQLSVLKKLFQEADQLIHAGDPDREGQLLVDQVIAYHRVPKEKLRNVKRCLISDMNPAAVRRAIDQLRDNTEFTPLSTSALARTRADWLYGINLTRAYTTQGRKVGYNGVLSVGRVQTPILGLVVRRDQEIASFVSKPFFEVKAHLQTHDAQVFTAKWRPSEACQSYMDEEGRVLLKKLAENVALRITDKPGIVQKIDEKLKKQAPPLPFNLSALQIEAARLYGLSARQVLDTCQTLYERHKLITYPRSDSRYLPVEHFQRASKVIAAVANNSGKLKGITNEAHTQLKSAAWNDKKVDAHHAIIPTEKKLSLTSIGEQEKKIYELIARQYLYQFFPKHEYFETFLEVIIEGGLFTTNTRRTNLLGWKSLYSVLIEKSGSSTNTRQADSEEESENTLPPLTKGDILHCSQGELVEKKTQPPKHFTDATLLSAMTGISRFVKDPKIRKILRETDGLGTEATRANIIELLFKRGYLKREKKQIRSTPAGVGLVESLPEIATCPDMTAEWESRLNEICNKTISYDVFMKPLTQSIYDLVEQSKSTLPIALKGVKSTKTAFKKRRYQKRKSVN